MNSLKLKTVLLIIAVILVSGAAYLLIAPKHIDRSKFASLNKAVIAIQSGLRVGVNNTTFSELNRNSMTELEIVRHNINSAEKRRYLDLYSQTISIFNDYFHVLTFTKEHKLSTIIENETQLQNNTISAINEDKRAQSYIENTLSTHGLEKSARLLMLEEEQKANVKQAQSLLDDLQARNPYLSQGYIDIPPDIERICVQYGVSVKEHGKWKWIIYSSLEPLINTMLEKANGFIDSANK